MLHSSFMFQPASTPRLYSGIFIRSLLHPGECGTRCQMPWLLLSSWFKHTVASVKVRPQKSITFFFPPPSLWLINNREGSQSYTMVYYSEPTLRRIPASVREDLDWWNKLLPMYVQRGLNFWHKQYIEQYRASIETNVSMAWECSTLQSRKAGNRQTLTRSMHSAGWFKGKCYRQTEEWKRTRIIQVSVYTRLRPFSWYFKSALPHGKINELHWQDHRLMRTVRTHTERLSQCTITRDLAASGQMRYCHSSLLNWRKKE